MSSIVSTNRESESKKPPKRFNNPGLQVQARTIGSSIMFNMPAENVSTTGMLLTLNSGQKAPFNVNTILELKVNSGANFLDKNVQCLGKIIHTSKGTDGTARYGIKIIQHEDDEQSLWQQTISHIEYNNLNVD